MLVQALGDLHIGAGRPQIAEHTESLISLPSLTRLAEPGQVVGVIEPREDLLASRGFV